jgi:ankyrin repeat protein
MLSNPELANHQFERLGSGEQVAIVLERNGESEVLTVRLRQPTGDDYREEISRKDLFEAARDGDIERVQELIDAGADVNETTRGQGPALAIAVEMGQAAAVQLLIDSGAVIDIRDSWGRTLLVYALDARKDAAAVVKVLLDAGIDVNARDDLGRIALSNAVIGRDDEVFNLLVEYGSDISLLSDGGSVALQSALANNHVDRVVKLLDLGVDVNARSSDGQTALFTAVDSRWSPTLDAVQLLLDRGAEADIEDHYGGSPLKLARKNLQEFLATEKRQIKRAKAGKLYNTTPEELLQEKRDYQQIVALLEAAGAGTKPPQVNNILQAARTGDVGKVNALLQKGEHIDAIDDKNGYSPLIWALSQDHEEVAQALLENKADPNIVAKRGETALMVAIERGTSTEILASLLAFGADPNLQTGAGTALMIAALHSPIEVVKQLLESGADPNLMDGTGGYTAAYAAMMAGRKDVFELLVAAGAK